MRRPRWILASLALCSAALAGESVHRPLIDAGAPPSVPLPQAGESVVREVGPDGEEHPVVARLLADRAVVEPGGTVRLGVHLEPKPGWHTYWRSPGDIGLPTKIRWTVPDGAAAADFAFPLPQRFDTEGIVSYGYDGAVLLWSEVRLPADLPVGTTRFAADAEWLVCEVMCIRGEAKLGLSLPVATPAQASPQAPLFDHWARQHPTPPLSTPGLGSEPALSASAVRAGDTIQAAFRLVGTDGPLRWTQTEGAGTWPLFTPIVQFNGMITDTRVEPQPDGAVVVRVTAEAFDADPLPDGEVLGGLFQLEANGKKVATEVTLPVPWAAAGAEVVANPSPLFATPSAASAASDGSAAGIGASADVGTAPSQAAGAAAGGAAAMSLWMALLFAFLGGNVLNVMPCVLPVLTMKLYSLIQQGDIGPGERRAAGLAYGAGIVASFLALAVAVLVLQQTLGTKLGWGFQFQSPSYVVTLATIVFAFGLSMFGVFEVPAFGANQAASASAKDGLVGYFMTGVFATLLATPCSAPFLGPAMGFAFSLPGPGVLLFFGVAGFGLAFPFLVIAFVPALFKLLPKPGAWMDTFKQAMGFTLMATTVWLVDVLAAQVGRDGATGFLVFLLFVSIAAWALGRWGGPFESTQRQLAVVGAGLLLCGLGGWRFIDLEPEAVQTGAADTAIFEGAWAEIPWQPFSDANLAALRGTPVFIDFTADWCLTCKVNEKTVLAQGSVKERMRALGVVPLKADYTRRDESIGAWLRRFQRAGVPMYVVVDAAGNATALPDLITPDIVVQALEAARGG